MMALADDDVRFTLDRLVAFRSLAIGEIEVRVLGLAVSAAVLLDGEVDLTGWQRLFDAGCFHLDDEPPPVGFEADRPVHLVLRLRSRVAAAFGDADQLLESLLSDRASPLRHTEAWKAVEATQRFDVPGVEGGWTEIGLRTGA
jgi:hypothetical protein